MKNAIRLLLLAVSLAALSGTAMAQGDRQRPTREQLAEVQARHIAEEIALDDETSDRFIETYCNFQGEIWALGRPHRQPQQQMTEEEAGQALKAHFAHSQKILDLRQKYYGIYSGFMTQKQIMRVYELERQMMARLSKRGIRPDTPKGRMPRE